ncbi:MAG: hypothetical protein JWR12_2188 [Mucilaginibacter sp.]|nr:hypothetical protein [Mucilaginibacter sp.]
MNWESFFIGAGFLLLSFFLYKMRRYTTVMNIEELKKINSVDIFINWVWIIESGLFGIGCIIHSL